MLLPVENGMSAPNGSIMTVTGKIPAASMGKTLVHEHILVDFAGADRTGYHRWNRDQVQARVLPFLQAAKAAGCQTFVDCTPAFLGRDPLLLQSLAKATGLQILTNTGYYGARDLAHLPPHAFTETAAQLARRWTQEFEEGIEGTGIRPGFIKIGVNGGKLAAIEKKLVRAAVMTHLQTGLVIYSHTGPAVAALEQIALVKKEGADPGAFVWVHAQNEKNLEKHLQAARMGSWVSLDGLGWASDNYYLLMLKNLKKHGLLHRTLLSHDAGWYQPDKKDGGEYKGHTRLFRSFVPAMLAEGFTEEDVRQLLVTNPALLLALQER